MCVNDQKDVLTTDVGDRTDAQTLMDFLLSHRQTGRIQHFKKGQGKEKGFAQIHCIKTCFLIGENSTIGISTSYSR